MEFDQRNNPLAILVFRDWPLAPTVQHSHPTSQLPVRCTFPPTVSQSGAMADAFRHRFSTKPWIAALGAYDYGERLYSPELRRWLSRDPIEEEGGENLYAMCGNNPVNTIDAIGLSYFYSIYFGVGHPQYNPTLRKAANVIVSMMKKYIPPADAVNNRKCLLQVASNITSGALREASKSYDELYFVGHGALKRTLNMNRKAGESMKNFYAQSVTAVTFADGDYRLSDVLTTSKKEVKSKILYVDVCYDAFLDMKNPSGVPVIGVSKSTVPVQSIGLKIDIDQIKRSFAAKKCCSVEVRRK